MPVFLFLVLFLFPGIINAQSNAAQKEAQQRMEKAAAAYFEQDDLVSAYPLYSQLLSIYPHDPTYNYRFGACMLYANGDKKKAIKYILYALKQSSVDNLAYYYLGRAMHLNYEFDQAIRYYLKFQELASSGELKRYPVNHLIEMCRNAKELLANSQELDVLRKKSLSFSIFWEGYSMRTNGGTLITEPDEFKSKMDKKNKLVNLMYLTPDKNEAFFSSYGNNEDKGKDIYMIRKKADGTWGTAENLGTVINTSFDEDYPVYDSPRNILYFCSKGHNSMGGYDIFSSAFDDATQTWAEPVNLDFPINTPDDDILLVPDTSGQFAFFASARSSPQGKIEVYKVALHLHPPGTVVVAGRVSKTGTKTPVYSIVTVRDSATNRIIAIDTTSSQDGSYSFNLSKGGKYVFTIEDSAHHSQTKSVVVAAGETDRAVEQNIGIDPSGAVKIENHAVIVSPDSNSRLALQLIKNAAQMEVNVDTNSSFQTLIAQSRANNSTNRTTSSASPITHIQNATAASPSSPKESSPGNTHNTDTASTVIAKNNNNNVAGLPADPKEVSANNSHSNASENNNPVAAVNNNPVSESVIRQKPAGDSMPDNATENGNPVAAANSNSRSKPVVSEKLTTDSLPNDSENSNLTEVGKQNNSSVETTSAAHGKVPLSKNDANKPTIANSEGSLPNAVVSNTVTPPVSVNNNPDNATVLPAKVDSVKVEQLQQAKRELDNKETKAIDYAGYQIGRAQSLRKKLDAMLARKKHNKDSVAILSGQVNEVTQKVMDAYQLAAEYKNEAEGKQSEVNKAENSVNNGNTKANNDGVESRGGIVSAGDVMQQQLGQMKDDSAELAGNNAEVTKEINELEQQSADFLEQARQAIDTAQRNALLQQVDDLSKSKAVKQEEIDENNTQLQQLHDEYAWLNGDAKKADIVSLNSGNGANVADNNVALQKEIDVYSAKTASDSIVTGNDANQIAADGNSGNRPNKKRAKHSKKGNITQAAAKNSIASNESQPVDVSNASNTSKPVAANQENSNIPAISNATMNQNTPVDSTNTSSAAKESTEINSLPASANTEIANQNRQTDSTNTSSVKKEAAEVNTTPASVSATPVYHPDSAAYYKAPDNRILDSLANVTSVEALGKNAAARPKEQATSLSISTAQYTDDIAVEKERKSEQYITAASQLAVEAKKMRNEAKHEPDKVKATQLLAKADSLTVLTYQLNLRGTEIAARANSLQYSANIIQLKNITAQLPDSGSDKVTNAQLKLKDAQDNYNKYAWERDSAHNSPIPAHKQQYMQAAVEDLAAAIVKQQRAMYLYKQADSDRIASSPAIAANSNNNTNIANPGSITNDINSDNDTNTAHSDKYHPLNLVDSAIENKPTIVADNPVQESKPDKIESGNNDRDNKEPKRVQQSTPDNSNIPANTEQSALPDNTQQPIAANSNRANIEPAPGKEVVEKNIPASAPTVDATKLPASSNNASSVPSPEPTPIFKPAVFSNASTSTYSAAKPIPVDPVIPQGLIFGVQVGAFRNAIPPDLFKGFEPIIGLKTAEGFVRYIAGTFKTFNPAKDAAAKIRSMGYTGAFVVAYYNGKRISIKDALAMLGTSAPPIAVASESPQPSVTVQVNSPQPTEQNNNIVRNENPPVFSGKGTSPTKRNLIDNKQRDIKAIKDSVPPPADNISDIKGLVYTVQVGSFSKRKGFARLQKIKHLYYWAGPDGTIKYNSGVYANLADARSAKDIIVANTVVKDAFVTAYYQGQRITPQQAASLLGSGLSPVQPQAINNSNSPAETKDNGGGDATNNSFVAASRDKVVYSVQIASFTGKLPVDTVNKLLTYASEGIEPHKEEGGITTYYAGKLTDYESAEALRQKFLNGGFNRAAVVAFYRGRKISVEEARSIKNQ